MIENTLTYLIFLWQAATPVPEKSLIETLGVPAIILLLIGNLLQFLMTRGKTASERGKLDAEAVASFTKTIKEIQETNDSLFDKMGMIRAKLMQVEDELEHAKDELQECLDKKAPCDECQEALIHAIDGLSEIHDFLKKIEGAEVLIMDTKTLIRELKKKVVKREQT